MSKDEQVWIAIQVKTFTRWANNLLEQRALAVEDLKTDFSDGYLLHQLLEILGGEPIIPPVKRMKMKIQRIESLNVSLRYIASKGIKLVAIGAEDIYGGSLKLILGLLWTLILRFQISTKVDEDPGGVKSALLEWVNKHINSQGVKVSDFKGSWCDGKAFCALVNALQPGEIDLQAHGPRDGMEEAFEKSLLNFKIPKILDSDDVINHPDEQSIMTYVAFFRTYFSMNTAHAPNCTADGAGLRKAAVFEQANFVVTCRNEDNEEATRGGAQITCNLLASDKSVVCPISVTDLGNGKYHCQYTPTLDGEFDIEILVKGAPIKDSPFKVTVAPGEICPNLCEAFGDGLSHGNAGVPAQFTIISKNRFGKPVPRGGAKFKAVLSGNSETPVTIVDNQDGTYSGEYTPTLAEKAILTIECETTSFGVGFVKDSPFFVTIQAGEPDYNNLEFEWPDEVSVGQTSIIVHTKDKFDNRCKEGGANITGELKCGKNNVPIEVIDKKDGSYELKLMTEVVGNHELILFADGNKIAKKKIFCKPAALNAEHSIAYGPGVKEATIGNVNKFSIQARDSYDNDIKEGGGHVTGHIQSEDGTIFPLQSVDKGDGTYECTYPSINQDGVHTLYPLLNDKPVKDSPFSVMVHAGSPDLNFFDWLIDDSDRVVTVGEVDSFKIQSKDKFGNVTKTGGLDISGLISGASNVPVEVTDNNDGTYTIKYTMEKSGPHKLDLISDGKYFGNKNIVANPGAPSGKHSIVYGDGIKFGKIGHNNTFTVQSRDKYGNDIKTGGAKISGKISKDGKKYDVKFVDNNDGTYLCSYPSIEKSGIYTLEPTLDKEKLKGSPFKVDISAGEPDPSKFTWLIEKSERVVKEGVQDTFYIQAKDKYGNSCTLGSEHALTGAISGASKAPVEIVDVGQGSYQIKYTLDTPGKHKLEIKLNGKAVGKKDITCEVGIYSYASLVNVQQNQVHNVILDDFLKFDVELINIDFTTIQVIVKDKENKVYDWLESCVLADDETTVSHFHKSKITSNSSVTDFNVEVTDKTSPWKVITPQPKQSLDMVEKKPSNMSSKHKSKESSIQPVQIGLENYSMCHVKIRPSSSIMLQNFGDFYSVHVVYQKPNKKQYIVQDCPFFLSLTPKISLFIMGVDEFNSTIVRKPIFCSLEICGVGEIDFKDIEVIYRTHKDEHLEGEIKNKRKKNDTTFISEVIIPPPQSEGRGSLEVYYKGEGIAGFPKTLYVIAPYARIETAGCGVARIFQQYYFTIATSYTVTQKHLKISVVNEKSKKELKYGIFQGSKPETDDVDDPHEDDIWAEIERMNNDIYYNVIWICEEVTKVKITVYLNGEVVTGCPFAVDVQEEDPIYHDPNLMMFDMFAQKAKSGIPISEDKGISIKCYWQTQSYFEVPLSWTLCAVNDIGEITETMLPEHKLSKTGAVQLTKVGKIDGNVREIFIRPFSLRSDNSCVVLVLSCLIEDFTEVKRLIFSITSDKNRYYIEIPCSKTDENASFLCGVIAKSKTEEAWKFDPLGLFARGRFITDFLPHLKEQITKYTPIKPASLPYELEKGIALAVHPKIVLLNFEASFEWNGNNTEMELATFCYNRKEELKLKNKEGGKIRNGILIQSETMAANVKDESLLAGTQRQQQDKKKEEKSSKSTSSKDSGADRSRPLTTKEQQLIEKLCVLATKGDVKELKSSLSQASAIINKLTKTGYYALHNAAKAGQLDCLIEILKVKGINPDIQCTETANKGNTALHFASMNNHDSVVAVLIASGVSTTITNHANQTPKQVAKQATLEVFNLIEKSGSSALAIKYPIIKNLSTTEKGVSSPRAGASSTTKKMTKEEEQLLTSLCSACETGNSTELTKLLKQPAIESVINLWNNQGFSPLYIAAKQGDPNVVVALLNFKGINADVRTREDGSTPLHIASSLEKVQIVALLLAFGAKKNILDKKNHSARQIAKGKAGNVFDQFEKEGASPLFLNNYPVLSQLTILENLIDPIEQEDTVNNLCDAASEGDLTAVTFILSLSMAPLIVNKYNESGQHPLLCAAKNGHSEVVLALLNVPGIDPDTQSKDLRLTALHSASANDHPTTVALLLAVGANFAIPNKAKLTPKQAAVGASIEVYKFFEKDGLNSLINAYPMINQIKSLEKTLLLARAEEAKKWNNQVLTQEEEDKLEHLCHVARNGVVKEVNNILNLPIASIIINRANKRGHTALFCASSSGETEVVLALLNFKGINLDIQSSDPTGNTCLHEASATDRASVVALLLAAGAKTNILNKAGVNAVQCASGISINVHKQFKKDGVQSLYNNFPIVTQLNVLATKKTGKTKKSKAKDSAKTVANARFVMDSIVSPCKMILIFAVPKVSASAVVVDKTMISHLSSFKLQIHAKNDVQKESKKKDMTLNMDKNAEKRYLLASYKATPKELGDSFASLAIGKLFRRNKDAPWEFVPFGIGLKCLPAPTDETIMKFLKDRWIPDPQHLKLIILNGTKLPQAIEKDFNLVPKIFLIILPAKDHEYQFKEKKSSTATGLNPFFGESMHFPDLGLQKDKNVNAIVSCWCEPVRQGDPALFLGECKIPLKYFFKESEKEGCHCFEKEYELTSSKAKKVFQVKKFQGSLKFRFIAY